MIFAIIIIVLLIVNNIHFIHRARKTKVSSLYLLAIALTLNSIMTFCFVASIRSDKPYALFMFALISLILNNIILLTFAYFFESYEKNSYFSLRTTFYAVSIGIICGFCFILPPIKVGIVRSPPLLSPLIFMPIIEPWYIISTFFVSLIFSIQAILIFIRAYQKVPLRARKYIIHMLIAVIIYSLGMSIDYFFSWIIFGENFYRIQTDPLFAGSFLAVQGFSQVYFAITYGFLSRHPAWLQIPRIHNLFVFSENGIAMFSHHFKAPEQSTYIPEIDDQLFGGGFSALKSFFSEIAGRKTGNIQEIRFHDFSILMEVHQKKFSVVLLAESATVFAITALKAFADEFAKKYTKQLEFWKGDIQPFQSARALIQTFFEE